MSIILDLTDEQETRLRKSIETLPSAAGVLSLKSQSNRDGGVRFVNGHRRTCKIHLGSGNILMSSNDQYLRIIAEKDQMFREKLFLSFEGDPAPSVILSKALLLADDERSKINRFLAR